MKEDLKFWLKNNKHLVVRILGFLSGYLYYSRQKGLSYIACEIDPHKFLFNLYEKSPEDFTADYQKAAYFSKVYRR